MDSSLAGRDPSAAADEGGVPPLVLRLMDLCKGFLTDPSGVREMAAILMGE